MKINLDPNIKEPIRLPDWRNPFLSQGRDNMSEYKNVTVRVPEEIAKEIERGHNPKFSIGKKNLETFDGDSIKPWLKPAFKKATELAEEQFSDLLEEQYEVSQYASKREELMKECTHPESHRIYPDHTKKNSYENDLVWHCTACGYAKYKDD